MSFRFGHGLIGGSVALVALQVLVTSKQTSRLAQLFALPAAGARWLIDPTIPAIPNRAKAAAPTVQGTAPGDKSFPGNTAPAAPAAPAKPSRPA